MCTAHVFVGTRRSPSHAQALPNAQVFYVFTRGAGKCYGVLWFGNVSVYSRFGYKIGATCNATEAPGYAGADEGGRLRHRRSRRAPAASSPSSTGGASRPPIVPPLVPYACTNQGEGGPTCGTSLSLMKRLMYAQIFYNAAYVSFENGWFDGGGRLTSIGAMQAAAVEWVAAYGAGLGVHVATTAIVCDYFQGFVPPRHLYSGNVFRAWGNAPYGPGDYLTDGLLRLFYPGYADASYMHDESGFSAPTPYGDVVDVLLTDAAPWLLGRYASMIVAGTVSQSVDEVAHRLRSYVAGGGALTLFGANSAAMSGGVCGCAAGGAGVTVPAGASITLGDGSVIVESASFTALPLACEGGAGVAVATLTSAPGAAALVGTVLALYVVCGSRGGALLLFGSPSGLAAAPAPYAPPAIDVPLGTPYPLLGHVQALLAADAAARAVFALPPGLSWVATRRQGAPGVYTLAVSNPGLLHLPFSVASRVGPLLSLAELPLDESEKGCVGYVPDGYQGVWHVRVCLCGLALACALCGWLLLCVCVL